jgi:hypothetical protein
LRQVAPGAVQFAEGPQGAAGLLVLTPQNVNDLLPGLVAFANTGVLS